MILCTSSPPSSPSMRPSPQVARRKRRKNREKGRDLSHGCALAPPVQTRLLANWSRRMMATRALAPAVVVSLDPIHFPKIHQSTRLLRIARQHENSRRPKSKSRASQSMLTRRTLKKRIGGNQTPRQSLVLAPSREQAPSREPARLHLLLVASLAPRTRVEEQR